MSAAARGRAASASASAHSEVVCGLSASVDRGEWVALIGPNGAGKTTTLRALAGLVPFRGSVLLEGRALAADAPARDRQADRARPAASADPRRRSRSPSTSCSGARPTSLPRQRDARRPPRRRARDRAARTAGLRRAAARLAQRRRAPAGGARAGTGAGGAHPAARRADERARPRPSAAGARARRRAAPRRRAHGRRRDARPEPRRPVRRPAAAARPRPARRRRDARARCSTEATIGTYYGAEVRVIHENGSVFVLPRRTRHA